MKWKKIGIIFDPKINSLNGHNHSMTTSCIKISENIIRIFYNSRVENNKSIPLYFDMDIANQCKILKMGQIPIIEPGGIGSFDENGIVLTSTIKVKDKLWMYYSGFPRTANHLFQAYTGLALSNDNGISAKKMFEGPIIGLSKDEPYWAAGPRIYNFNNTFHLYYTSCSGWEKENENLKHYYEIKVSRSKDGINWDKGKLAIGFKNKHEYAIAIPSIIKDNNIYKMWYTFRAQQNIKTYRIGYAESIDGLKWHRKDELMSNFEVSEVGWDSEMLCFPYVFNLKEKIYMLYNGNGFGSSGIGLAVLED